MICQVLRKLTLISSAQTVIFDVDSNDNGKFARRIRILDCYTDPLGWKHRLKESGQIRNVSDSTFGVTVFRDVRNLENLLSGILELGKGIASC